MIDWEKEEPIQYFRIDSEPGRELQFLSVMVPTQSDPGQLPFFVSTISAASVVGALVSRDGAVDRHLYRLAGVEVSSEGIRFDGATCFVSNTREGVVTQFALQGGTSLKFEESTLVHSSNPIEIGVTLGNTTSEGSLELERESHVELLAYEPPALLFVDGKLSSEYAYDSKTKTLGLDFEKGLHSIKILWQSSYQTIQQLLQDVENDIGKAEREGRTQGLDELRRRIVEARETLALGDYEGALLLAKQALELARRTTALITTSLMTTSTEAQTHMPPTQAGWLQSDWSYIALVAVAITVIAVVFTFTRKRRNR
jgi:hypothetical protein